MKRKIISFTAIPFLIFLAACQKPAQAGKKEQLPSSQTTQKTETLPEKETTPRQKLAILPEKPLPGPAILQQDEEDSAPREGQKTRSRTTDRGVEPTPFKDLPLTLSLTIFPGSIPVQAEDFKIGQLPLRNEKKTGDALSIAEAFLISAVKGKADSSLLSAQDKDFIMKRLTERKKESTSVTRWRLSTPQPFETSRMAINVRIFGPGGSAEGEISLIRENDAWKIDGFNIDLDGLSPDETGEDDTFEPQVYRVFTF